MVVIDSDVFLIVYRFHRDERAACNARFLAAVMADKPAVTIYNLMEILGSLSFNLSPARLTTWPDWLKERYQLAILWPQVPQDAGPHFFEQIIHDLPLRRMLAHPTPFLDALILEVVERTPDVRAFVTWNARHFAGKTRLPVLTPAEYLEIESFRP